MMTIARLLCLSLLLAGSAAAEYESALRDAGSLGGIRLADSEDPNLRKTYIVQLKAPAAAEYHATLAAPAMTKPGAPTERWNITRARKTTITPPSAIRIAGRRP